MKYRVFPDCSSHLDFGEVCDYKREVEKERREGAARKGGELRGGYTPATGGAVSRNRDRAIRVG